MEPINSTSPIIECLNNLRKKGFTNEFQIKPEGLYALDSFHQLYTPDDVKILEHFRFEGDSNPEDMAVIYAIQTTDGVKGTLMDSFGTYGNTELAAFISKVKEIPEKANSH